MTKNKRQLPKLIILLGTVVLLLAMIQLSITHYLASASNQIADLEKSASLIEKENIIFIQENEKCLSLEQIAVKAEALGFVGVKDVWYLTSAIPVALK